MAGEIYISRKLNSINIAGHFYQTGSDRLVASAGTGTTVTITDTGAGRVLVKNAPYNKLVDEGGTTFGASQSAVVTALNAYFTAEDPDGIVTKNDNLLKLSNIDQTITASKAGSIIVVGSGDGALTASTATVNSFLQPNTAISTSGITNTGTISSTGAITTDSFMRADYLILEGATADNFETTLTLVDPTQDNTITLPNASGTVALTSDIPNLSGYVDTTGTIAAGYIPIFADSNTLQGSAAFQIFNGVIVSTYNMDVADLSVSSLVLSSAGTPSITVDTGEDLNITSKGNVTVQLDSDNNEPLQKFAINDGTNTQVFAVDEAGDVTITGDLVNNLNFAAGKSLIVGSDEYAFKYITGSYGLKFDTTNAQYAFTDGSGNTLVSFNTGNGDTDINRDLSVGRNLDVTGYITIPQFVENETNKNDRITFDASGTTAGRVYDLSGTVVGPASATATYKLGFVEVANESMILRGLVTLQSSLSGSPALGQPLYLGSSGIVSVTAPSTSGDIVRVVGYYMGEEQGVGSIMYFDPSNDWVELS